MRTLEPSTCRHCSSSSRSFLLHAGLLLPSLFFFSTIEQLSAASICSSGPAVSRPQVLVPRAESSSDGPKLAAKKGAVGASYRFYEAATCELWKQYWKQSIEGKLSDLSPLSDRLLLSGRRHVSQIDRLTGNYEAAIYFHLIFITS